MTEARLKTGVIGEQIASEYLTKLGYKIIDRNYRFKFGELDIIAKLEEYLIFCEVKTRRGTSGPHPSLSVTTKKVRKLRQLGESYLTQKHLTHLQPRFDVIAVQLVDSDLEKNPPIIDHIINAF